MCTTAMCIVSVSSNRYIHEAVNAMHFPFHDCACYDACEKKDSFRSYREPNGPDLNGPQILTALEWKFSYECRLSHELLVFFAVMYFA